MALNSDIGWTDVKLESGYRVLEGFTWVRELLNLLILTPSHCEIFRTDILIFGVVLE